jgi:Ca-activated chloride channel family protein
MTVNRHIVSLFFLGLLASSEGCNVNNEVRSASVVEEPKTQISPTIAPLTTTQTSEQFTRAVIAKTQAAEASYQQLLAQYGENYQRCLEPADVTVDVAPNISSPLQAQSKQLNVLVALDASGSMAGRVRGKMKMNVAKSAIAQFVSNLPQNAKVGLTVFGHQGSNQAVDKAVSCAGIETIYPLAQLDNLQFTQAVNSFQPTGFTPLATTLEQVNASLSTYDSTTNQNVVYLVSDGIETCDGDPVLAASQLHASNAKAVVNVIGFNVDKAAQKQLEAVAAAGGGEYFSADNADELNQVFERGKQIDELDRYRVAALERDFNTNTTAGLNRLIACVTIKMNREFANVISQTNRSSALGTTSVQYNEYVLTRLQARQAKIAAWRDRLQAKLGDRQDLSIDKLKQELAVVSEDTTTNVAR